MSLGRTRVMLAAMALASLTLAACARNADVPRTTFTIAPAATPEPTASPTRTASTAPAPWSACTLLTADEREAINRVAVNDVVPLGRVVQKTKCEWVPSLRRGATQMIIVEALDARSWAVRSRPGFVAQLGNPNLTNEQRSRIRGAIRLLSEGRPSSEEACDLYWLQLTLGGTIEEGDEVVYPFNAGGQLPGYISTSCDDGVYTSVSYGKYRLFPTPTLGDRLITAREAAEKRAKAHLTPLLDEDSDQ